MNTTRGVKTGTDQSICSGSLTLRKSPATASQATLMPRRAQSLLCQGAEDEEPLHGLHTALV